MEVLRHVLGRPLTLAALTRPESHVWEAIGPNVYPDSRTAPAPHALQPMPHGAVLGGFAALTLHRAVAGAAELGRSTAQRAALQAGGRVVKRPDPLSGKLFAFLGWLSITAVPCFLVIAFALAAALQGAVRLKHSLGMNTPPYLLVVYALALGGVSLIARLSLWLFSYTSDDGKPQGKCWCAGLAHFGLVAGLFVFYRYVG